MSSLNKVQLIGRLGNDPEVRYTQSGDAVCNLSLATSETWKDKNTGEKKEATEWHRCTSYRKLAEVCGQYLKKGALVYVEGKLVTRKWTDKEGVERYTTEIVFDQMIMLGGKSDGQRSEHQGDGAPQRNQSQQRNAQGAKPSFDDLGDDIPFAPHAPRGSLSHVL